MSRPVALALCCRYRSAGKAPLPLNLQPPDACSQFQHHSPLADPTTLNAPYTDSLNNAITLLLSRHCHPRSHKPHPLENSPLFPPRSHSTAPRLARSVPLLAARPPSHHPLGSSSARNCRATCNLHSLSSDSCL